MCVFNVFFTVIISTDLRYVLYIEQGVAAILI